MNKKQNILERILLPLILAAVMTALASLGALREADQAASDLLYQRTGFSEGQIVLITIDDAALERLGPYQSWSREVFTRAIETLNADPDRRPAVIGLDVLFTGETDPETDAALAAAAAKYGNVLTASSARFGSGGVETQDGNLTMDGFAVMGYYEPYAGLAEATRQGHVNAMLDADGRVRRQLLFITTPEGERVDSFALEAARMYSAFRGLPAPEEPETGRLGVWYLPFTGRAGFYNQNLSLAALLDGKIDPVMFEGKIVLIGAYTEGLQDSVLTGIDRARPMYGVEVQANAVEAMLRGNYKSVLGEAPQLAALFVLTALAVAAFWRRRVWTSTALLALLCGGWLALCRGLYDFAGVVLHPLWIPAAAAPVYAVSLALNYIRAALETRRVTRTFKLYQSPEVVAELLRDPAAMELGGRLMDIAVLFVDVRGFTTMSELLEPPQVVEILNRYLTLVSDCIHKNGGTLDKFIGDAAMAFWGAPLKAEDPVYAAARAAMDMVEGARNLSAELTRQYGRTVSFGVGVHYGKAVVGSIGSPQRMDYTAIGDTVNTASRLEARAPGGTVYISRAVAQTLGERADVTSLGPVELKGKKEGFEILTLDALR